MQVQWGTGAWWQALAHRPGRAAVMALGPKVQLQVVSVVSGLSLPLGLQFQDALWLVDAAARTMKVPVGSDQFTVVAFQDEA